MTGKRQREQQRLESDASVVRRAVPAPIPPGGISVRRTQPSEGLQRQQSSPLRDETASHGEGGLYIISVAARLLEMHPQTLRKYERVGLISPPRTEGMLRLYSREDIVRLRLIKHLVEDLGINLAGVEFVLTFFSRLREVRERVTALEEANLLKEAVLEMLNRAFEDVVEG